MHSLNSHSFMKSKQENIFTNYGDLIQRDKKEKLLNQRALTIWLTGLSGSGKTTIAQLLELELHEAGFATMLLDGDNVRDGLNSNLDFSESGRHENIRRIAEVNKLFNDCGVITINCFVSPTNDLRKLAREIVGSNNFMEIFINTPLEICEARDVKGLYKKARAGEIKDFTGVSAPFDIPENPELEIRTEAKTAAESAGELYKFIHPKIVMP